ncbi:MAG: hypothetical protein EOP16_00845 [Pseudonocardia sp.]|nr:MAG: hypothetical protein EOP16_00845 [Pseudonocardia sp.]
MQLVTVIITAVVSIVSTLAAVFFGPAWKDRLDVRSATRQRSDHLIAQYSEPLARAAFELQSRLYNIYRQDFMHASRIPGQYRGCSTLWLFGQLLAWIEIVRREIQIIDFGDIQKTTELQRHLFDVADILASDRLDDPVFRMFRADQRATGDRRGNGRGKSRGGSEAQR